MDRYKRLASNTLILAFGQMGSKLLVYVMMRFYTEKLGPDGYGAVGNIVDASTLLIAIVTLSIGESIIRFGLDKSHDRKDVFTIGIRTSVCGLLIFLPFVPLIGQIDFLSDFAFLIYLYVFTGSLKSACALFTRSIGFVRIYAVDGILTTAVNIILNLVFLAAFDFGVVGYVVSVVLADLFSILFLFMAAKLNRYIKLFGVDKRLKSSMYRFCLPLIPTSIMWWVANVSDSFFITAMLGVSMTGVYKAAYKFPNLVMLASGIFSQAWNMSAVVEKDSLTISKFYTNVFNFFQSTVYLISAAILLVIRPVLGFMAVGEGFENAFRYSPLLLLAVVFTCFSTFMGSVYIATKKSVRSMTTASIGAGLNLLLNWLLIPIMGINGAALSTLISYAVIFFVRVYDTRNLVHMDLKPYKMGINMLLLTTMSMVIMFVNSDTVYYVLLSISFVLVFLLNIQTGLSAVRQVRGS
ncbi:MAG: polysaccharide biosynthesis C-terminal domain-containing protein [Oscillospiraceae bacterium]|nr:polysaccharide biosynthesis C-terminal domain-containing protein [Oscillospiraceae bacterium]